MPRGGAARMEAVVSLDRDEHTAEGARAAGYYHAIRCCRRLLRRDLRALARDTLPARVPLNEHVDVPIGHLEATPLAGTYQMPREPDDGSVAVDLDDEF